jgi:hypothetical protein
MTNNEVLNKVISDSEAFKSVPIEQAKNEKGQLFSYDYKATLTANVASYRGFVTGDKPIVLKSISVDTGDEDVTIEVSEDATFTDGTEVSPVARNRKTQITNYREEKTIAYNVATALANQPIHGVPTINRVLNNGNILYPDVAVAIAQDPFNSGAYGIQVNDVAQVDESQGLSLTYQSKQVRSVIKQEIITDYTADELKVFVNQSYDEAVPVIKAVYNDNNIPLSLTSDYTIDQDESDDWGITILSTGDADTEKNIIVVYEIEEEYTKNETQEVPEWALNMQKVAIDTPIGTFEVGEIVIGGTSDATGVFGYITSGFMYLHSCDGEFETGETITGDDSEATVDTTADGVRFFFVEFDEQSYDDSAITVATVANGTRGARVEYLSFTQDYTFALDTTYKITLKDTAKTDATKPTIYTYSMYSLIANGDGLKIYTAPTVTNQGNVLETYWLPGSTGIGQSRQSAGMGSDWEFILRPNTKYLIKGLSTVEQDVLVKYRWYIEG